MPMSQGGMASLLKMLPMGNMTQNDPAMKSLMAMMGPSPQEVMQNPLKAAVSPLTGAMQPIMQPIQGLMGQGGGK